MRNRVSLLFCLLMSSFVCFGQVETTILKEMPTAVSNNAVAGIELDGFYNIYSFGGIDESKSYSGIHKHTYKYEEISNEWTVLADLPSGNGRIAASASTVKDKIYIIGGYEVLSNGNEISYNNVHVFDPLTDTFLADASPIPVAIDDHVHAVYKDSLIFIVTGWSNTTNVPNVQIYDPSLDVWSVGTSLPNTSSYKVFGATGRIIGDTIYYIGGAYIGSNFPLSSRLKKGYINPENPTDITWSKEVNKLTKRYRPGSLVMDGRFVWFGGSTTSYNYNADAYNGSGIVSPSEDVVFYDGDKIELFLTKGPAVMDLRSVIQISDYKCIISGGMLAGGVVTDQCIEVDFSNFSSIDNVNLIQEIKLSPNPAKDYIVLEEGYKGMVKIYNMKGALVLKHKMEFEERIDISTLIPGTYLLKLNVKSEAYQSRFVKF